LQRLERDLAWFDEDLDSDISNRMSRTGNPISDFSDLHESEGPLTGTSMTAAHLTAMEYLDLDKNELHRKVIHESGPPHFFASQEAKLHYLQTAIEAEIFLTGLRDAVQHVDAANWPKSASKPVKPN
jgi:hypothetical protein